MTWNEIRAQHPGQWLLVEAIQAHSAENRRVLEQTAVIQQYSDSTAAIRDYLQLHREAPNRELYVLHTDRTTLDIQERRWLGIRGA